MTVQEQSMNHNFLKIGPRCDAKSPTVQDIHVTFRGSIVVMEEKFAN